VGEYARRSGIEHFWAVGELCAHAAAAYGASARLFGDVASLLGALGGAPAAASVLVKGSRFMRMERAVQALVEGAPHAA